MATLTRDEFEKQYGKAAVQQLDESQEDDSLFTTLKTQVKDAFGSGIQKAASGFEQAQMAPGKSPLEAVEGGLKVGAGTLESAFSPLAPLLAPVGKAIQYVSGKIADIPAVQKFAGSKAGETTARVAEDVADLSVIGGTGAGLAGIGSAPKMAGAVVSGARKAVGEIPKPPVGAAARYVASAARDVLPTKQGFIDHQIARALDLTPGDMRNIASRTGNEVGPWLSEYNLIGTNKANTQGLVDAFFTENYKAVRSEIGKVKNTYEAGSVPRYKDSLEALAAETQGKLGLEAVNKQIVSLLKKEEITLADVQRVKELLDDHFTLYKVTGDVQSGLQKQGLANVRSELQTFIENEVRNVTGADIRALNNNVATAKSLADAIRARAPRGLTRDQVSWRDAMVGMGVYAFTNPLVGLSAVLAYKLATSATARLRMARWVDSLSDAEKTKLNSSFKEGKVPSELVSLLNLKDTA